MNSFEHTLSEFRWWGNSLHNATLRVFAIVSWKQNSQPTGMPVTGSTVSENQGLVLPNGIP